MDKNGSSRRARAAKINCLQNRVEKTKSDKAHASSEMINKVVEKDFAGLLKMKTHKSGLLNVSIVKQDARVSMKPTEHVPLIPTAIKATYRDRSQRFRLQDIRYSSDQKSYQPWKNTIYPLNWREYYTTQPIEENQLCPYLHRMKPEKRIVWDSGARMTRLAMVCRQVYDEVGLIPYSTNEFSFCSPYALRRWLHERLIPQRQAIKVLWLDIEWASYGPAHAALKDLSPTGATLKISQPPWKIVSNAYWKLHEHRDIGNAPIEDLDADMDNFAEFEEWLEPTTKTKALKVEYVIE